MILGRYQLVISLNYFSFNRKFHGFYKKNRCNLWQKILVKLFSCFGQFLFANKNYSYNFVQMVKQLTQGVEISVQTRFLPAESSIRHGHYFFMYDITIENKNEFSVQLLSRHWHINDSNGEYREVKGEGVVGEQPIIEPGQKYNYRSGCNLASEIGKMQGTYKMVRLVDDK